MDINIQRKRLYNMDVCRCLAIMGILSLHILSAGGLLGNVKIGTPNYWILWILEIIALPSVNVFAMLSGYLGWQKEHQNSFRLIELMVVTLFYSVIITALMLVVNPSIFMKKSDIIYSLIPALKGYYWYITCYIPIVIFQPYINKMIKGLNDIELRRLCITSLLIIGVISSVFKTDFFGSKFGYSFIWLLICYIVGAYISKCKIKCKNGEAAVLLAIGGGGQLLLKYVQLLIMGKDSYYLVNYQSPFIIVMSIAFILLFNNMKLKNNYTMKIVSIFSSVTFDIYIIHCHPCIYDYYIKGHFSEYANSGLLILIIILLFSVLFFFTILGIIGIIRNRLFKSGIISKLIGRAGRMLDKLFYYS